MLFSYIHAKLSIIPSLFSPTYTVLFSMIPFTYRWRALILQSLNLFAALIISPTWLFTDRYTILYIPTRSGRKRCLVYRPPPKSAPSPSSPSKTPLYPLHISIHGGAFIGGLAEQDVRWNAYLSDHAGAIVISPSYRLAPRHTFPTAHDDIDDILAWLLIHAEAELDANPHLITIGGSSAGGTLALSATQKVHRELRTSSVPSQGKQSAELVTIKAFVGFCPVLDFRLPPWEKRVPPDFPRDPLAFMAPMFDAYAGPGREGTMTDARLHPVLARREDLPERVLVVVAGIDILRYEQEDFVGRLREEIGEGEGEGGDVWNWNGGAKRVEMLIVEKAFHGWIELPRAILEPERLLAFRAGVETIRATHRQYGWNWEYEDGKTKSA